MDIRFNRIIVLLCLYFSLKVYNYCFNIISKISFYLSGVGFHKYNIISFTNRGTWRNILGKQRRNIFILSYLRK